MIKIKNLEFEYFDRDEEDNLTEMIDAIRGINFDAEDGAFIAVAGKNGSGKSTFAKILNHLLVPIDGTVIIDGIDAINDDDEKTFDIRRKVGMVFQNPDDQIIGSIVSEDVAFGAENIGIPYDKLWDRVYGALKRSGLGVHMADRRIDELSGGEKQKVAIAGVLAMKPKCIVLDEATSMLDPISRYELLRTIKQLNVKYKLTVIMITHNMEELFLADYIYIMDKGRVCMQGRREAIISYNNKNKLESAGLKLPIVTELTERLYEQDVIRDKRIYSVAELAERIKADNPKSFTLDVTLDAPKHEELKVNPTEAILINHLNYSYGYGQKKHKVLDDVSLSIAEGEYVAIVGKTGAGKSTLIQLIPGLLSAGEGMIYVDGIDVMDKATDLRALRSKIGLVLQYPERQLFARNAYEDVVFGPKNMGISEVEAEKRAYEAIKLMGLSEDVYDMPVSRLSGGEKRRLAMAGVLAMQPKYLILDEPLSGLDPAGRQNMLDIIRSLHDEAGITVVMVTHDIESVAGYVDRVIVLDGGKVISSGRPAYVFYEEFYRYYEDLSLSYRDKEPSTVRRSKAESMTALASGQSESNNKLALLEEEKSGKKLRDNLERAGIYEELPTIMQLLIRLRLNGLDVDCFTVDIEQGLENIIKGIRGI